MQIPMIISMIIDRSYYVSYVVVAYNYMLFLSMYIVIGYIYVYLYT